MSETLTPDIQNVAMTTLNTEYSIVLPSNCKGFSIQCRTAVDVRFAFVTGKVAGSTSPFFTLKSGQVLNSVDKMALLEANKTIYFGSGTGSIVVEVLTWA